MSVRHLAEITCEQMAQRTQDILLLPLGSTEQHTTHLPMGTDTMMADSVAEAAAAQAGEYLDLVLAPPLPYGISDHHVFAGAASLRPGTYQVTFTSDGNGGYGVQATLAGPIR